MSKNNYILVENWACSSLNSDLLRHQWAGPMCSGWQNDITGIGQATQVLSHLMHYKQNDG